MKTSRIKAIEDIANVPALGPAMAVGSKRYTVVKRIEVVGGKDTGIMIRALGPRGGDGALIEIAAEDAVRLAEALMEVAS